MLFRNLQIYAFKQKFSQDLAQLEQNLQAARFVPCSQQALSSIGFVSPVQPKNPAPKSWLLAANNAILLCACREEKVLPAGSVRDELEREVIKIEQQQGYKVGKKQKAELKDDIIFNMLPRAFCRSRLIYAYIDLSRDLLIVDAPSSKLAEAFCECLRHAIGTLPVGAWSLEVAPQLNMTRWLREGKAAAGFVLGDMCELADGEKGKVRISNLELAGEEIQTHLDAGRLATKLRLFYGERLGFTLDAKLEIKQLKFLDVVQEERADSLSQSADAAAGVDADFAINVLELRQLLPALEQALTA